MKNGAGDGYRRKNQHEWEWNLCHEIREAEHQNQVEPLNHGYSWRLSTALEPNQKYSIGPGSCKIRSKRWTLPGAALSVGHRETSA